MFHIFFRNRDIQIATIRKAEFCKYRLRVICYRRIVLLYFILIS